MYELLEKTVDLGFGERLLNIHHWKNGYKVSTPAKGNLFIVHGLGEHTGRYDEMARFVASFGFDVWGVDLPGHGLERKNKTETDLLSPEKMVAHLKEVLSFLLSDASGVESTIRRQPWFLLGHSMGAMLSLRLLQDENRQFAAELFKKAVICAPPFELRLPVPSWKRALAHAIGGMAPHFRIQNGIRGEDLSFDPSVAAAYDRDPLNHHDASPELFLGMEDIKDKVFSKAKDIEIPVLMLVGEDDPIVEPSKVKEFYAELNTHKKLMVVAHAKHEVFNELNRKDTYKEVIEWIL